MTHLPAAKPLHVQLKESIIAEITRGAYSPGDRLPSQRELCRLHGMSHMTIRRAIDDLVRDDFIVAVPGSGLFVKERSAYPLENFVGFNTLVREGAQIPSSQVLDARLTPATSSLAHHLKIAVKSEVVYLHRLRFIDGRPVMIQQSWLPHGLCPRILAHDFAVESLFEVLARDYTVRVYEGHQTISARLATPEERQMLQLPDPGVVLTVDALEYARPRRPVEYSISIFNPQTHPLRQSNRAG